MSADVFMHKQVACRGGYCVVTLIYGAQTRVQFGFCGAGPYYSGSAAWHFWVASPKRTSLKVGRMLNQLLNQEQSRKTSKECLMFAYTREKGTAVKILSPRFTISLIMESDLTFRKRFVNLCRHIILLVSQILNNERHILLCDSLGMPFELHVATDKHNTECAPVAGWRYHNFKLAIATLSAANNCLHFSWVICMFLRISEGREELRLMIIFGSACTRIENAQGKSPPEVTLPRLHLDGVMM